MAFSDALAWQDEEFKKIVGKERAWSLLGFESSPVITLGVRALREQDLFADSAELERRGYRVMRLDRGGHATLHGPGQLVVFPIAPIASYGVRRWVECLAEVSVKALSNFGIESWWDEKSPGIYTANGKIGAVGIKVRRGVSTHGLALNVSNAVEDFNMIRACGVRDAAIDRISNYRSDTRVLEVWLNWRDSFLSRLGPES